MATIVDFGKDLGQLLTEITSGGVGSVNAAHCDKLGKLGTDADSLGMKNGKKLIDNLTETIKSFQAGKSEEKSVSVRLTALDFYQQNIATGQGEAEIEDL
jgi:Tfp pilus assembly protein FimT